jgi:hypothetical protein
MLLSEEARPDGGVLASARGRPQWPPAAVEPTQRAAGVRRSPTSPLMERPKRATRHTLQMLPPAPICEPLKSLLYYGDTRHLARRPVKHRSRESLASDLLP